MSIEGIFYVYAEVANLGRAKSFYADTLGWHLYTDEAEVAGFWFGSGYLVARLNATADGRSGRMHVAVKVTDLEAEHARLAERGVKVGELQVQPWGESNFTFTDPDGYTWVYAQAD